MEFWFVVSGLWFLVCGFWFLVFLVLLGVLGAALTRHSRAAAKN